jgi:hypothetical protein
VTLIFGTDDLDFMLGEFGDDVAFAEGVYTTKCLVDREEILGDDGNGVRVAGVRTVLFVRDGTQPDDLREDQVVTVTYAATGATEDFCVRDTGVVQPDGLRKISVVEV